jgi:nucleotide-binding universal stress UspA family protein
MLGKILAALDGSRTSESVLPYVESLLGDADADVTLATVAKKGDERKASAARVYLKKAAARLRNKGAVVDTAVLLGDPASELTRFAREGGYSLLAMCTRGKTGLKRLILGSVAEDVLKRSSVPVLVVHPLKDGEARKFRKIVIPLDGSHRSASVLGPAARLAKNAGAKVAFVTVVSPTRKDELPVEVVSENLFREQKSLQKLGLEVDLAILYGDPTREILTFAENNGADLVAISSHGRSGLPRVRFGSVAEKILRQGRMPLLVLRTDAVVKTRAAHGGALKARRHALEVLASVGGSKSPYSG